MPTPPSVAILYFFCTTLSRVTMRSMHSDAYDFALLGGRAPGSRRPRAPPPAARSGEDAGRTSRSREVQGDRQGADAVRRSPPGHRSQSRRGRLDRGAAQELRLPDRARSSTSTIRRPPRGGGRGRGNTGLAVGGGRPRGDRIPTGVNTDPMKQPDEKLRALNMQPTTPGPRERCTAPRSAPPIPTRCTSSAATWTATAGARPRTTMARARRW